MVSCSILKIKRLINFYDRFQILTAVLLSVEVLVDMTPCHWGNTSFKTRRRVPELYNFTISYFLKKKVHIQWRFDHSHLRCAEHRHVGFFDSKTSEYSKVEAVSSDMMTSRFQGRLVNSNWREWNLWTEIQNCRKHKLHFPCKWKRRLKYHNHMCQCSYCAILHTLIWLGPAFKVAYG